MRTLSLHPRTMLCIAITIALSIGSASTRADVIYQSALLGPSVTNHLFQPVLDYQQLGVRFELTQPAIASTIGAHLLREPGYNTASVPASIVQLSGPDDFPDFTNSSSNDYLATAFLDPPQPLSGDVSAPIGPITLQPGWYALVYGDWGTDGSHAVAVQGNTPIGAPSFFSGAWNDPEPYYHNNGPGGSRRFFLLGTVVPEPTSMGSLAVIANSLLLRRRR